MGQKWYGWSPERSQYEYNREFWWMMGNAFSVGDVQAYEYAFSLRDPGTATVPRLAHWAPIRPYDQEQDTRPLVDADEWHRLERLRDQLRQARSDWEGDEFFGPGAFGA